MQTAHRVAKRRGLNGRYCHRKRFVVILGTEAAQGQELLERNSALQAILAEILVQQSGIEKIDARRHRGVRGEHAVGPAGFERFLEGELVFLDEAAHALDGQKRGMAFVHVPDRGLQIQPVQRAQAADSQDNLLPDARKIVAAIKLIGDLAMFDALVFRNVGVQQIELHASDVHVPDLDQNHAGRQLHRDDDVLAVFVPNRPHRKRVEIVDRVALLLPAIRIERLLQVALLVQQTHADQRNRAIAGGLQVIAGKHAQSAAINRHAFHQPVLHRKIRDQAIVGWLGAFEVSWNSGRRPGDRRRENGDPRRPAPE